MKGFAGTGLLAFSKGGLMIEEINSFDLLNDVRQWKRITDICIPTGGLCRGGEPFTGYHLTCGSGIIVTQADAVEQVEGYLIKVNHLSPYVPRILSLGKEETTARDAMT